jgi:hypothetical protein
VLPHSAEGRGFLTNNIIQPLNNYCHGLFVQQRDTTMYSSGVIPKDKKDLIGNSTIDIFPIDVYVADVNNLNYDPRPVPQSYSVYSCTLDSLNAQHFYKAGRPQYVLMSSGAIDDRYPVWDESLTKAMIHLNYRFADTMTLKKDPSFSSEMNGGYILYQSKPGAPTYPKFERLAEKTVAFNDTVRINFPGNEAVYMTADIQYSPAGKFNNIFFQPVLMDVTFFLDSACTQCINHRAVRPLLERPVLINKYVGGNTDLMNFLNGTIVKDRDVRAFAFHANAKDVKPEIKVVFYRLVNY